MFASQSIPTLGNVISCMLCTVIIWSCNETTTLSLTHRHCKFAPRRDTIKVWEEVVVHLPRSCVIISDIFGPSSSSAFFPPASIAATFLPTSSRILLQKLLGMPFTFTTAFAIVTWRFAAVRLWRCALCKMIWMSRVEARYKCTLQKRKDQAVQNAVTTQVIVSRYTGWPSETNTMFSQHKDRRITIAYLKVSKRSTHHASIIP